MFRIFEVLNTIISLFFNILGLVGIGYGVQLIKSTGFDISENMASIILFLFLIYFSGFICFFILRWFSNKHKISSKDITKEMRVIPVLLYFFISFAIFPIWFFSAPSQMTIFAKIVIVPVGIIFCTILVGLFAELLQFLYYGTNAFEKK